MKEFITGAAYPREEENTVGIRCGEPLDKDKVYFSLFIDQDSSYIERTEAALHLTTIITQQISLNRGKFDSSISTDNIHIRFAKLIRTISNFTGYFIGCESWRKGKIQQYDQAELIKRLENIILMVING